MFKSKHHLANRSVETRKGFNKQGKCGQTPIGRRELHVSEDWRSLMWPDCWEQGVKGHEISLEEWAEARAQRICTATVRL